jgi:ATP-dependent RNA helicase DDX21
MITHIEQKAGIKFQKIGIPQPEDVIKASSRDIIRQLDDVNSEVLPIFEETADLLIKKYSDPKKALQVTLAFLSGHYKSVLESRSLLTG